MTQIRRNKQIGVRSISFNYKNRIHTTTATKSQLSQQQQQQRCRKKQGITLLFFLPWLCFCVLLRFLPHSHLVWVRICPFPLYSKVVCVLWEPVVAYELSLPLSISSHLDGGWLVCCDFVPLPLSVAITAMSRVLWEHPLYCDTKACRCILLCWWL